MNIIRQREEMADMVKAGMMNSKFLDFALPSPVFQWWCGDREYPMKSEEYEFITTNLFEMIPFESRGPDKPAGVAMWPKSAPFDAFRISYQDKNRPDFDQWVIGEGKYLCVGCDTKLEKGAKLWSAHASLKGSPEVKLWTYVDGKKKEIPHGFEEDVSEFAIQPMKTLAFFLFDIYSGTSNVVKVSPDAPHRSVQWRQSREHYLVLHHKQTKELQATGRTPDEGDLIRSAHWRRAHLRRLSAGRYVNKRGLLVPVKKAWVGPEEWKGKDGKIYTVVGLNAPGLR